MSTTSGPTGTRKEEKRPAFPNPSALARLKKKRGESAKMRSHLNAVTPRSRDVKRVKKKRKDVPVAARCFPYSKPSPARGEKKKERKARLLSLLGRVSNTPGPTQRKTKKKRRRRSGGRTAPTCRLDELAKGRKQKKEKEAAVVLSILIR